LKAKSTRILLLAVLGVIFFAWHYQYFPVGADYHFSFRPAVVTWLDGSQQLYDPPYYRGYNPPWIYFTMVPMSWLGYKGFLSALALCTAAVMVAAWRTFARGTRGYAGPLSLAFCFLNLHVFDLFFRGQVDGYLLLGVTLLYEGMRRQHPDLVGTGWMFAVTRPTGNLLLLLYSAWVVYRQGYLRRALVIPLVAFLLSLVIFNPGWIQRYIIMLRDLPPELVPWHTTLWHIARYFHASEFLATLVAALFTLITIWVMVRYRPGLHPTFAFLLSASLLVAPYALSYHYLVVIFVAIPLLLSRQVRLALPLYALTLTPLMRLVFGIEISWIDMALPLTIWLLLIYQMSRQTNRARIFAARQLNPI
jgi:hypothetical protein